MDCRQCSNNLSAYLDGELLSSYEQEVSSHLQGCASCARELREMEAAVQFVETHAHDLELNPELWNNLRTRIAPMPAPLRGGFSGLWARNRWLAAAASVAAAIVLAVGLFAYMDYAEEREIRQYMSDYIREREREDQLTNSLFNAVQTNETDAPEFIELANPFATVRPVSNQNPFR